MMTYIILAIVEAMILVNGLAYWFILRKWYKDLEPPVNRIQPPFPQPGDKF